MYTIQNHPLNLITCDNSLYSKTDYKSKLFRNLEIKLNRNERSIWTQEQYGLIFL